MIGHKYVPSREGGIEVVVDNLATRMVEKGHEVTLFNRKRKEYEKTGNYICWITFEESVYRQ